MGFTRIFCQPCNKTVKANFVRGAQVYPKHLDLIMNPYWQCPNCKSFVGCHPNTIKPLGIIAGIKLKQYRSQIHHILDFIWQNSAIKRSKLYKQLSDELGWNYHTANIRSIKEAKQVLAILDTYKITIPSIDQE